jgi:hypothetical protein
VALQVSLFEAGKQKYLSTATPIQLKPRKMLKFSLEETLVVRDAKSQGQGGE